MSARYNPQAYTRSFTHLVPTRTTITQRQPFSEFECPHQSLCSSDLPCSHPSSLEVIHFLPPKTGLELLGSIRSIHCSILPLIFWASGGLGMPTFLHIAHLRISSNFPTPFSCQLWDFHTSSSINLLHSSWGIQCLQGSQFPAWRLP